MSTMIELRKIEASRQRAIKAVLDAGKGGLPVDIFDEKLGEPAESMRLYNRGLIVFENSRVHLTDYGRKLAKGR